MTDAKGVMVAQWWVFCAQCHEEWALDGETASERNKEAREGGWVKRRVRGWTCPDCCAKKSEK